MAQSEKLKSTKGVQLELASLKMLVSPQAKYLRGLGHMCVPFSVSRSSILTVGFVPLLYLREHLPHSKELSLYLVMTKLFFCITTYAAISGWHAPPSHRKHPQFREPHGCLLVSHQSVWTGVKLTPPEEIKVKASGAWRDD